MVHTDPGPISLHTHMLHVLNSGPLVLVAFVYEGLGFIMAWVIKQFFWVPHQFRYGILVAGTFGNVGDIRESFTRLIFY